MSTFFAVESGPIGEPEPSPSALDFIATRVADIRAELDVTTGTYSIMPYRMGRTEMLGVDFRDAANRHYSMTFNIVGVSDFRYSDACVVDMTDALLLARLIARAVTGAERVTACQL